MKLAHWIRRRAKREHWSKLEINLIAASMNNTAAPLLPEARAKRKRRKRWFAK